MKLLNALIFTIGVVSAQDQAYGDMLGQLYVGACSATQADMYNTQTTCYAPQKLLVPSSALCSTRLIPPLLRTELRSPISRFRPLSMLAISNSWLIHSIRECLTSTSLLVSFPRLWPRLLVVSRHRISLLRKTPLIILSGSLSTKFTLISSIQTGPMSVDT